MPRGADAPKTHTRPRGPAQRSPLPFRGGKIERTGDPGFVSPLAAAFDAQDTDEELETIHRFHSYPARMHPALARTLLEAFHPGRAANVLDPFCGSGTVPLEAVLAGWRAIGSDLNPLALALARVKARGLSSRAASGFLRAGRNVVEQSLERVQGRVPVHAELPRDELRWYDPHVLKELAGLLEEIRKESNDEIRSSLELVFSAIVVKFSRQKADTREERSDKRIRKGLVSEFFGRKCEELVKGWEEVSKRVPKGCKRPTFVLSDARRIGQTLGSEFKADLILTSPPYAGTYDYARHHARRMAWLGISMSGLQQLEIGARRQFEGPTSGQASRWDEQLGEVLRTIAQVQNAEALNIFLIGDGEIAGRRVSALQQLQQLAPECGYQFVAAASQERPDPRSPSAMRPEHLIVMMRDDSEVRSDGGPRRKRARPGMPARRGPR